MGAKLSDLFLHLLGNVRNGIGDTISGITDMTPQGRAANFRGKLLSSEEARSKLSTMADLSSKFNTVPAGTVGPQPQGTFTPPADVASLAGLPAGASYSPVQPSVKLSSFNTKTGKNDMQDVPLQRGQTFAQTQAPMLWAGQQLGFQKDAYEREMAAAADEKKNAINALGKIPNGLVAQFVNAIGSSSGLPQGLSDLATTPQAKQALAEVQMAHQNALSHYTKAQSILSGAGGPGAGGAGATRPPPPSALTNPPAGHIAVWNKASGQYGFIPEANFNPLLHEKVAAAAAPVTSPQ